MGDDVLFLFQGLGGEPGPVPVHGRGLRLTVRPAHADFEPRSAGSPSPAQLAETFVNTQKTISGWFC